MNTAVGLMVTDAYYLMMPLPGSWAGLRSLIPATLSLGLIGYSVVNPGSAGGARDAGGKFNRELYIRWLQVDTH